MREWAMRVFPGAGVCRKQPRGTRAYVGFGEIRIADASYDMVFRASVRCGNSTGTCAAGVQGCLRASVHFHLVRRARGKVRYFPTV